MQIIFFRGQENEYGMKIWKYIFFEKYLNVKDKKQGKEPLYWNIFFRNNLTVSELYEFARRKQDNWFTAGFGSFKERYKGGILFNHGNLLKSRDAP